MRTSMYVYAAIHVHLLTCRRPCGLMGVALDFGTKDCRFESCQGHFYASLAFPAILQRTPSGLWFPRQFARVV